MLGLMRWQCGLCVASVVKSQTCWPSSLLFAFLSSQFCPQAVNRESFYGAVEFARCCDVCGSLLRQYIRVSIPEGDVSTLPSQGERALKHITAGRRVNHRGWKPWSLKSPRRQSYEYVNYISQDQNTQQCDNILLFKPPLQSTLEC
ncbi:hypothetical protein B0J14DRAFT_203495 [Halenospora varia]|nr:hypothetical protein B0J14DRAFT_203495 [Halenospora varia]